MNHLDTLEVFAELAIAVVGFSGIVAALKFTKLATSTFARIQLSVLLGYGAGGVVWALLPLILLRSEFDELSIWRYSSLVFLVMMIGFAIQRITMSKKEAGGIDFAGRLFPVLAVAQMSILAANIYFANGTIFSLALLSNLCIGVLLFWRLIRVDSSS